MQCTWYPPKSLFNSSWPAADSSLVENRVGAIYRAAGWYMTTWIPFIWGWANVFVLVVSSFSYSGGL